MKKCYFCNSTQSISHKGNIADVKCALCGNYQITDDAAEELKYFLADEKIPESQRRITNAIGWLKENYGIRIYQDDVKALMNISTPTVAKRAEKLLKWLETKTSNIGERINWKNYQNELKAITYSVDIKEVEYLLFQYLEAEKKFIEVDNDAKMRRIAITPKGYAYLDTLNKVIDSQIGFCAMWFDEKTKPLWRQAIRPAILAAGYEAKRIDEQECTEGLVDEIIALIRNSCFVVADLTNNRGGVYYEAGFAKGIGLNVIFTCNKEHFDERHFDVQHYNCLTWQNNKLNDFKIKLTNRIEATIGHGNYKTQ